MSEARRYHLAQYDRAYDSTVALDAFMRRVMGGTPDGVFMDVGCGAGGVLHCFEQWGMLDLCGVIGIDADPELLAIAHERNPSMSFAALDFNDPLPKAQVTTSVQVLSFIEDWRKPLEQMIRATSDWVFVTSLFWKGVSAHIHASDKEKRDAHYNIIETEAFETACRALGAKQVIWQDYEPPRSFLAPRDVLRSRIEGSQGGRVLMSGPLYLPWAFVAVGMREALTG